MAVPRRVLSGHLLLACLLALVAGVAARAQPNVLLIVADDQAWTDYGFMGHEVIRTPHLDALAAAGAVFENGYVPSSLCRPSLATMLTGLYPHQHGITGNDPPPGVPRERMLTRIARLETVPELLARHGYRCLQTGKWWEGSYALGGFTDGMTHGDPRRGGRHGDEGLRIGRRGLEPIFEFVDRCRGEKRPFFVWYAPLLPHTPHDPPARLLERYRVRGRSEHVARYYAMCEWLDETCGELLAFLERRGLEQNTLVVFLADNGWIQRPDARGFAPRSKRTPYEGGVRTPIVLRWPGRVAPGRRAELASSIDLAPTILAACGVPGPSDLPGLDLVALASGKARRREAVFGATFEHDVVDLEDPVRGLRARWVRRGRDKLIWPAARGRAPELYDLVEDPHERHDLAARRPERVAELQRAIEAWWPARLRRPETRPGIVVLVSDDQRADALSCAGHPILRTPHLDRLAAEGVRFDRAFVTTSICAASRATLLTGLYRRAHGFTFGTPPLGRRFTRASYPRMLREAGYRTGFVGKLGVKLPRGESRAMFDDFRPLSRNPYFKKQPGGGLRHLTDLIADHAVDFLRDTTPYRPFCLSVSFHAPHAEDGDPRQYLWPQAFDGMYDDVEIPPPPTSDPAFFEKLPRFQRESLNRVRWRWRFTPDKREDMTRGYYRMISGMDAAVGRILAELERLGLEKSTVVVFTSDNGYFLGERGFAGKWTIHEPSIRVPLIVRDPALPERLRGAVLSPMVLNLDLAPTILDLAAVRPPATMQGRSLVPWLRGERPADWRTGFFYELLFDHPRIPKCEGLRTERWVYVRYFEQDPVYEELYDLENDPHEERNLATDPAFARVLERLRLATAQAARQAASAGGQRAQERGR